MKIVTDSGADLPVAEAKALGIAVAPLFIQFPEGEIKSSDIEHDAFYDRLEAMVPLVPTTAQPSPGVFSDIYKKLTAVKEEILSIHISSGLSGTLQSARLGSGDVEEGTVTLIDSLTLSGAQRFQVLAAAWAAQAGWSKEAIIERLDRIRAASEIIYTLETLDYLARGGRIGRVQALAGSLLKIKPVIKVDKVDGKYTTVGNSRTLKKAIALMVDHLAQTYGSTPLWVSVLHGRLPEQAQALITTMKTQLTVGKLEILRVSPVLGVHTGPGVVGMAVLPLELVAGLLTD